MRNTWLVGGALTLAAVAVVVVSDLFDLELESAALLGVAVGAIVALVPDRSPLMRLAGFLGGFAVAWVGYLVEARFIPDSLTGKAVSVALVVALCVVISGVTSGRVPLWSTLLGAAAMVGAYEYTFAAAIPEVKTTSVSAATELLMTRRGGLPDGVAADAADRSSRAGGQPHRHGRRHGQPCRRRDDGEDQVSNRFTVPLRIAAVTAAATVAAVSFAPAASAAAEGDVEVTNTETVQVYTDATGEVQTRRIYEQLSLSGEGEVDLSNPIETDGLRNLDEFGGYEIEDGQQITNMTVDGEERLRSVSDFTGDLPLEVQVKYLLDGEEVEPGDVVGESGELEVLYTVRNVTSQPQEVTYPDGSGGEVTETVDVPIPMVGSLEHRGSAQLHRREVRTRPTWPATARAARSCPSP